MEILFKEYIQDLFNSAIIGTTNMDLKIGVYEEYSNNPENDINITIKRTSGDVQNGLAQYSYILMGTVRQDLYKEIKSAFDIFANEYNNQYFLVKNTDNSHTNVFFQFDAHKLISNDIDLGLYKGVTFNIVCRIMFSTDEEQSVLKIRKININGNEVEVLRSAISCNTVTNSSGSIYDSFEMEAVNQSSNVVYTFDIVPLNQPIITQIMNHLFNGDIGNIKYTLNFETGPIVINKDCIVIAPSAYADSVGGIPLLTLAFTKRANL